MHDLFERAITSFRGKQAANNFRMHKAFLLAHEFNKLSLKLLFIILSVQLNPNWFLNYYTKFLAR